MPNIRAVVTGVGHGVPEKRMTNFDLMKFVDTSDEWIRQRTGIAERRVCGDHECTSTISTIAALEALEDAKVDPKDLDFMILGTVTGDMLFPATSCIVQSKIGATNAFAFDLNAACAGFIYSVSVATAMIESGQVRRALVMGADSLTKFVDWNDRSTCVLFGDGAGAVVLEAQEDTDRGVIKTVMFSDGRGVDHIKMLAGGSMHPYSCHMPNPGPQAILMAGAEVYRFAVGAMGDACNRALAEAGMDASEIDLFVPHQANLRIIQSAADRLKLPPEKVFINVDRYGNTSGGSIPLALCEAVRNGQLKPGMVVMTVGFGAGLVWGANLIRW